MKKAQVLYEHNRSKVNDILQKYGYPQTFQGMMQAHKEKGNRFLVELHNDISAFDDADGKGWAKFKNIFNKATDIVGRVGQGANVANSFLNRPEKSENPEPDPTPKKEPWKPNIYLWGGIAGIVIIILLLIYFFKSK